MNDTQHNNTKHNDILQYDTKHEELFSVTQNNDTQHNNTAKMLSVIKLSVFIYCYAECRYA